MLPFIVRKLPFSGILVLLAGCTGTVPPQVFSAITFNHLAPVQMAVRAISVEDRYVPPLTAPNAEHRMPVAPQSVLHRWPADRIQASGGNATARFVIVNAEVLEHALNTDNSLTAIFTNEQALNYEASVEATLVVNSDDGLSQGQATARARRSITVPENATVNEREHILFRLVEDTLREFDARMELTIRKHLTQWVLQGSG